MVFSEVEKILIDKYVNGNNLDFICFLRKDDYFYGWFEENGYHTADGVVLARINLETRNIEVCNVLIAPIQWNINYDDFVDAYSYSFEEKSLADCLKERNILIKRIQGYEKDNYLMSKLQGILSKYSADEKNVLSSNVYTKDLHKMSEICKLIEDKYTRGNHGR